MTWAKRSIRMASFMREVDSRMSAAMTKTWIGETPVISVDEVVASKALSPSRAARAASRRAGDLRPIESASVAVGIHRADGYAGASPKRRSSQAVQSRSASLLVDAPGEQVVADHGRCP